jgi:hypothetical protein
MNSLGTAGHSALVLREHLEEMTTSAVPSLKEMAARMVTSAQVVPQIAVPNEVLEYLAQLIQN